MNGCGMTASVVDVLMYVIHRLVRRLKCDLVLYQRTLKANSPASLSTLALCHYLLSRMIYSMLPQED